MWLILSLIRQFYFEKKREREKKKHLFQFTLCKTLGVFYLCFVGQPHEVIHEGRRLRALRITQLLHLQVPLCAKNMKKIKGCGNVLML